MIQALLGELESGGSAVGIDALARRLGTTPAAIEGALEVLARKGRVVRAGPTVGACDGCAAKSMCSPLMGQTTRYIPVPRGIRLLPLADAGSGGACGASAPVRHAVLAGVAEGIEAP
jgi:hypothetical protein